MFVHERLKVLSFATKFTSAECVALKLSLPDADISLISLYRPSSENANLFLTELNDLLHSLSPNSLLCLTGDINIDTLSPSRPVVCEYINILSKWGVSPTINAYTREEYLGNKIVSSYLDHVNVRAPMASTDSSVIKCKVADHYIVGCHFAFLAPCRSRPNFHRLNVLDIAKFDHLVADFDWAKCLREVTSYTAYTRFVDTIRS